MINRRQFLARGMIGSVAMIAPWLLTGCGEGIRVYEGSSQPIVLTPTLIPEPIDASMTDWMAYFATLLAIPVAAGSITTFQTTLTRSNQQLVDTVNARMQRNDFTGFSESTVYARDDFFYYTVLGPQGNTCTPFFVIDQTKEAALLEGPAALGMVWGTRDYLQTGGDNAQALFVPKQTKQEALGLFDKSYKKPGRYETTAGNLEIDYMYHQQGTGSIAVIASNQTGGILFDRTYHITLA